MTSNDSRVPGISRSGEKTYLCPRCGKEDGPFRKAPTCKRCGVTMRASEVGQRSAR